jgi:exocyst complex component 3
MRTKKDAAAKFKSTAAKARVIKHYRTKFMKCIADSIQDRFEEAHKRDQRDAAAFLDSLGWMYQDIIRIESDVVSCFPPSYDIYSVYIREYHKCLDKTIKKILSSDPEASILLKLHAWLKEYKQNMQELNVPPEYLEPPLLDGKEQSLIEDYLKLIIKKLDEWSTNLMKTEIETFTVRGDPPELDGDGLYGTQGAVILFQMVNQQVDLAMESGQGAILARVITDINRVVRGIQDQWTKVVEVELKKQIEKPEEVPTGLVEYCIALANDQIKCADFAEALSGRIEPLVSEKYRVTITDRLNDAIDGYLDVAKKCTQALIDVIFNDLKPATKQLFQPSWYDGIVNQIIETIRDYISDYQTYLNPALFEVLLEDLLDAFLVTYLTALANSPKLKMPAAANRIRVDVSEALRFFGTYKKTKELEANFEVVDMILSLLEASKSMVFLSYWSFAKVHGPNVAFVEGLMKARGDLDRAAVSEVMDSIKRKVKDENLIDRKSSLPVFLRPSSYHAY